jgi:positive regulator of sigma E activity
MDSWSLVAGCSACEAKEGCAGTREERMRCAMTVGTEDNVQEDKE